MFSYISKLKWWEVNKSSEERRITLEDSNFFGGKSNGFAACLPLTRERDVWEEGKKSAYKVLLNKHGRATLIIKLFGWVNLII